MPVVVIIRLRISISYGSVVLSVRSVKYDTEIYTWCHIKSMPWTIHIVAVPRIDVSCTIGETVIPVIMDV